MTDPGPKRQVRLVDFLRDWSVPALGTAKSQPALAPLHLRRASAEVVRQLGDLTPRAPAEYELENVAAALRQAWASTRSLTRVTPRNLRLAPWVLFFPRGQPERWLARDADLVAAWLGWLHESGRPRTVLTLLREFISAYPKGLPAFEAIRESLKLHIAGGAGPRLATWRGRCSRFGFLESEAPALLTKHWWDAAVSFEEYGSAAGLVPGLENSALVARASEQLVRSIEQTLDLVSPPFDWLTRSLEWIERDLKLRFNDLRVPVATALLSPFRARTPEARVQELVQSFLLRNIGDPRSQRAKWQGVPEDVRNVLLRWLVRASLEDFFRVLDETAADAHWKFRKAFWSAYLRRDVISDAWIVLGPAAAQIVRREFESSAGAGKLRMGEGTQSSHSVLLLRIGTLTIAEWSHNGKCWIWSDSDPKAPKLYETEYKRSHLRDSAKPQRGIVHMGSEDGRWQDAIARRIADETGIRVPRAEYMLERKRWR